ncbi:MAG: DNA-binding response OmpR family regulator [Cellvibrionaceae bacterium]|jgi:DNA-binding response OmpR family regulator
MKTILVIDDKANVRQLLREYLEEQGYQIFLANNGREGLFSARHEKPDLILLDLMMPEMDGFQFMSTYRRESSTPIIVLTAKEEESDTVLGLELGADDYVVKPFRMKELHARIRALLRRAENAATTSTPILRSGDLQLDPDRREVTISNDHISLTPTEFNLLYIFLRTPERVFNRETLLDLLAEDGYTGEEKTINVHIRNLRAKIEPDTANPIYIETVFGVGYRMARH